MIKDRIVIIPTYEDPDDICDYLWQTAKLLAHRNQTFVLLLDQAYSFRELISHRFQKNDLPGIIQKKDQVIFIRPLYFLPLRRFSWVSNLNEYIFLTIFRLFITFWFISHRKRDKLLIWVFQPGLLHVAKLFRSPLSHLVYEKVDYYTLPDHLSGQILLQQEQELVNICDTVTTNSKVLTHSLKQIAPVVYEVPLGFRLDMFQGKLLNRIKLPHDMPIVGFVGHINERLDFSLLNVLIKKNPQWRFVFVGPLHHLIYIRDREFDHKINQLFQLKNVYWLDAQPKQYIADIISQFDVATIPYNTRYLFNRYCFPMKIFEYFYLSKPVVATPIVELQRFPQYVKIGRTTKLWEKHIKSLLAHPWPNSYKYKQRILAVSNSWENKLNAISKIIEYDSV